MNTLFVVLLLAAPAKERDPVRNYTVTEATKTRPIDVHIAQNFITGLRFNHQVVVGEVLCGNTAIVRVVPTRENTQLNFTALQQTPKDFVTNCNVSFTNGLNVTLSVAVTKQADSFIDVILQLAPGPSSLPKQTQRLDEEVVAERVTEAVNACKADSAETIVRQAAEAIVTKRIHERAVTDNVVLAVLDHVKIGSQGLIRFSIENRSRTQWPAGVVKVFFYVAGKEPRLLASIAAYRAPIIGMNEEVSAAVSFDMFDLPESAKFVLQAFERNGGRHPRVEGFRL